MKVQGFKLRSTWGLPTQAYLDIHAPGVSQVSKAGGNASLKGLGAENGGCLISAPPQLLGPNNLYSPFCLSFLRFSEFD